MSQVWQPKEYIDFQVQKLVGRYFLLCFQHPSWWWTAIFCWHFCWPQQYIGFRFHLPGPESFTWMLCLTSKSPLSANKPHHLPTRLPAFVPSSFPSLTVEILAPLWLLLTRFLSPGLSPFPSEPLPNPPFPFHFHCWVSSSSIRSFKGAFGTCDMPGHGADTRNPEKWSTVCAVREARWCPPRSNRITGIPRVCGGGVPIWAESVASLASPKTASRESWCHTADSMTREKVERTEHSHTGESAPLTWSSKLGS